MYCFAKKEQLQIFAGKQLCISLYDTFGIPCGVVVFSLLCVYLFVYVCIYIVSIRQCVYERAVLP